MTYGRFAYLYDHLMEDVPYEKWQSLMEGCRNRFNLKGNKLLDIACGTGELSWRFASQGFDVTGVDLSADMLAVAKEKTEEKGFQIPFFEQNMAELENLGSFDIITIFCDSLNYLSSPSEVKQTFQRVHEHLNENGLFLFDVHSTYKMEQIFKNQTFTQIEDEICYIWNCFPGESPFSIEHELTFFVEDEITGKYVRFEEFHFQRTFSIDEYANWLKQANFELINVLGDFEQLPPSDDSERIIFVAKKIAI